MKKPVRYPVGEQSFEQLRKGGFLYVDKTRYLELIADGSKYYFLGRPRRFGKSLFLSTLKCFFEGRRELFKGLYIDSADWDWEPHPVLYLDLNIVKYREEGELEALIEDRLRTWEHAYGIEPQVANHSVRFSNVIRAAYEATGKGVVILVDECDKPLVNNLHNREHFERYRDKLAELYSNFKSSAQYIRLVFLTGVSRFGKLSVFSGLNNISDISLQRRYAAICGITEQELLDNFQEGICMMADVLGKTRNEIISRLKRRYDGYHFSGVSPDVYNPFSLLNTFSAEEFRNYSIVSGTPTLLVEQLKREHVDLEALTTSRKDATELAGLDLDRMDPVALFYQTGYLTIKSYDEDSELYRLGYPNEEVTEGFFKYILPFYTNLQNTSPMAFVVDLVAELRRGDVDAMMKRLQSLFAGLSYDMEIKGEKDVRNALYILFKLVGLRTDVEYRTSDGRIDILVRIDEYVYIMELKYDRTAEEALDQIKRKEYSLPWAADHREVIAIGINYSSGERRINSWLSECL